MENIELVNAQIKELAARTRLLDSQAEESLAHVQLMAAQAAEVQSRILQVQ